MTQSCFNVGPTSNTVSQHWVNLSCLLGDGTLISTCVLKPINMACTPNEAILVTQGSGNKSGRYTIVGPGTALSPTQPPCY